MPSRTLRPELVGGGGTGEATGHADDGDFGADVVGERIVGHKFCVLCDRYAIRSHAEHGNELKSTSLAAAAAFEAVLHGGTTGGGAVAGLLLGGLDGGGLVGEVVAEGFDGGEAEHVGDGEVGVEGVADGAVGLDGEEGVAPWSKKLSLTPSWGH